MSPISHLIYLQARRLSEEAQKELLEYIKNLRIEEANKSGLRPVGLCEGEIILSDDFNDPLPPEILDEFYKDNLNL